jgi:hypothetical protein
MQLLSPIYQNYNHFGANSLQHGKKADKKPPTQDAE